MNLPRIGHLQAAAFATSVALAAAGCGATGKDEGYQPIGGGASGTGATGGSGGVAAAGGGGGPTGGAGGIAASAGSGGQAGGSGGAAGGSGGVASCVPMPACNATPPNVGPKRSWKHTSSILIVATGFDNHRGR